MTEDTNALEQALRRDIDPNATVRSLNAKLSAYLTSAYKLYDVQLLGEALVLAEPNETNSSPAKIAKRTNVLSKSLGKPTVLYFSALSRPQRRVLIENGQPFITHEGDYYLPQLALSLSKKALSKINRERPFSPAQQAVFLYCLYTEKDISHPCMQNVLGLSSGSISSALSLFVELGLLEFTTNGKTNRKKSYRLRDKAKFYYDGISRFGSPVREVIIAPLSVAKTNWLKSGLSALAKQSDLLPPERPEFAVSPVQARQIPLSSDDSANPCSIKVLKYDPAPFAVHGLVDPLTMLLTIDDKDERISFALKQALRSCEWYQD